MIRLDHALVERGLCESREQAKRLVLAGRVRINLQTARKPSDPIKPADALTLDAREKYVSRGGYKLEHALVHFRLDVTGLVALDLGASTGGFTDCLLQNGAVRVYAVDVTIGQIAWKLRLDERVMRIERNARELSPSDIPEPIDLVTVDVSFISVGKVLPNAAAVAKPDADFLILVKPQFELRREQIGPGGIVSDTALHDQAIAIVRHAAESAGLIYLGVQPSHLAGAEGNQEYFLHARKNPVE